MLIDSPEEMLDLVNERDEVIGKIYRAEVPSLMQNKKGYVRAVGIFLQNEKKQILIPTRSLSKKLLPGAYDFSASGHVGSQQSYQSAALQELREELRINTLIDKLEYMGTITPFKGMPYFHKIYIHEVHITPNFNTNDFSRVEWLYISEIIKNIHSGHPAKQVILPALQLL